MRVQDYITKEAYEIQTGIFNNKTLPAGSFVKPIHEYYLPRHVKDSDIFKYWNKMTETFVYCHFGIVLIPRKIIREIV